MIKPVYQTDLYGVFLYETAAHELALDPGRFNVPFGAVETPSPAAPMGQIARWTGDHWEIVEDHRSGLYRTDNAEPYVPHQTVAIGGVERSFVGWGPLPEWLTHLAPPEAPTGHSPRWTGEAWQLEEDHRAASLYRTDTGRRYEIGTAVEMSGENRLYAGWGPVPSWLTTQAPLTAPAGQVVRWTGTAWELAEDHRNDTLYLTQTGEQYSVGAPVVIDGHDSIYSGVGPLPNWLTLTLGPGQET